MDQKKAENAVKGIPARKWNTNGVPSKPLQKVWNGGGKVVRDNGKGGRNAK
ncbi:MAG: hypothetical protein ACYCYP_01915 [Leptospirales bacterium]